jgi:hypothetical protein
MLTSSISPGPYKLEIRTQYAGHTDLKDIRVIPTDGSFTVEEANK